MGRWGQMAERKLIVISWTGICDIIISVEWIEIDEQWSEGRTLERPRDGGRRRGAMPRRSAAVKATSRVACCCFVVLIFVI